MPEFIYRGRSSNGAAVHGRLEATQPSQVAAHLQSRGVTPIEIRAAAITKDIEFDEIWRKLGGGRPRIDDMIMFCRQMHTITRAGLPLLQGMQGLADTTHNVVLADTLREVLASLESGRSLAASLARHPKIFSRLMISIIEVGEVTGTLDKAFKRLHEYISLERQIADRVRAASRYPAIVLTAIGIAITIITVFVIPKFAPIFRTLGDDIPVPTKILMGVSQFAQDNGVLLIVLGILAWFAFDYWRKTPKGRYRWDKARLNFPVIGHITREVALARITRSLALSLESGLPVNQTLTTIADTTGNAYLSELVLGMRASVERGETLSQSAAHTTLFTPLILQMIAVGEETGALSELLEETADHYEREVDYRLDNLSAALEPLLIVGVGVCVLILALGVFLPLWDMVGKARGF
ncbi:MAG: type II secretion system F family protein [Gammaproteobacteria bacterium]|nr:type II secretion system F family protein [Gammaproteobacteria bacterium]